MDVRFYPAAAGDPAGLDFAQCLGYYGYSKVTGPGGGGHLSILGASRLARCTFCSIFSPRTLVSRCASVSDQLSSSSLSVPFPEPTFFVPLLALPLPSWSPPPLPPKLCEAQSRH